MNTEGIMRRARRLIWVSVLAFVVPVVSAQTPPARKSDDLDVTMRVIVDPDAKVPDEIVRRIQLPKPAQPAAAASQSDKSSQPGASGQQHASDAHEQGRDFGQDVSEQAKQRSEEARRNSKPPGTPGPPPKDPKPPPPRRPGG